MNEDLKKMLEAFGVEAVDTDGNYDFQGILSQLAEKWDNKVEEIKASVEPVEVEQFMAKEKVSEKIRY